MTTKQIRHMEMRENAVREWVQDSYLQVLHVPGRINPAANLENKCATVEKTHLLYSAHNALIDCIAVIHGEEGRIECSFDLKCH